MANIIDTSYFFGELTIPQLNMQSVVDDLTWYIQVHERRFIADMFGPEFSALFLAGIASAIPADQIYKDILNGVDYTNSNFDVVRWDGLKTEIIAPVAGGPGDVPPPIPGRYLSPIANYVFWHYAVVNLKSFLTGSGEAKANKQNSLDADIWPRLIRIWNDMVTQLRQLVDFLRSNKLVYPKFEEYYTATPRSMALKKLLSKRNPII